jgi:hypothetical protein
MTNEPAHIIEQIKNELDIFKKAHLIESLKREKEMRIKEIANKLGMKSSNVCHFLRLNKLPSIVVDGYYGKFISKSHLFIIARLPNQDKMLQIYETVLAKDLTAAETEEMIREELYQIKSEGEYLRKGEIAEFERKMKLKNKKIYTKVIQSRTHGKLIIEVKGNLFTTTTILKGLMDELT